MRDASDALASRFIALAGGPDAPLVVIPTANSRADTVALRGVFSALGARHVTFVNPATREAASSTAVTDVLRTARGVFMTGGQSMVLEGRFQGTAVPRELAALLRRGGVLAGDSAGAIAIGCAWLTWLPDPFGKRSDGLCVLPGVAVSPHATAARGFVVDDEVATYIAAHPPLTGVNVDEDTFLVIHDGKADVVGRGGVTIVAGRRGRPVTRTRLASGTTTVLGAP